MNSSSEEGSIRLYLLRHGEVRSHHGDVPITSAAVEQAVEVGAALAGSSSGIFTVLSGETRRAVETAEHLTKGIERAGARVAGPSIAFALRNPDLYLGGVRVNMVSSREAFAAQVDGLDPYDIDDLEFFPDFVAASDRVGWWLWHSDPPGDDAVTVGRRVYAFAHSLANPCRPDRDVFIAVTHSPLLRAAGLQAFGHDMGEPGWISGLIVDIDGSGTVATSIYPEDGG